MNVQQYECYRINHDTYSLLYYPALKILNVVYFDVAEDDELEITLWTDETGLEDVNLDFLNHETIIQDLDYMRSLQ